MVFVMLRFEQSGRVYPPWRDSIWLNFNHQGSIIAEPVTRRQLRVCRVRSAARPCRWMWRSGDVKQKPKIGDGAFTLIAQGSPAPIGQGFGWLCSRSHLPCLLHNAELRPHQTLTTQQTAHISMECRRRQLYILTAYRGAPANMPHPSQPAHVLIPLDR